MIGEEIMKINEQDEGHDARWVRRVKVRSTTEPHTRAGSGPTSKPPSSYTTDETNPVNIPSNKDLKKRGHLCLNQPFFRGFIADIPGMLVCC